MPSMTLLPHSEGQTVEGSLLEASTWMVSLSPSQAVEGTAKLSNWGRWRDGTGLALPCVKNPAASAQPRNLRPRLQQGESSTVEREWEERVREKGNMGKFSMTFYNLCFFGSLTQSHPMPHSSLNTSSPQAITAL